MHIIISTPGLKGGTLLSVNNSALDFLTGLVSSYSHKLKLFKDRPASEELMASFNVFDKILKRYFHPFHNEARKAQKQLVKNEKEKVKTLKINFCKLVLAFKNFQKNLKVKLEKA